MVVGLIAEYDARKLYLPAAYPSMLAYCVGELHLSEDAAFKRIRAARTGRQFPAVLSALADHRLHLAAVVLLTPHLSGENADELIAAATHKSKFRIEQLLVERFLKPDVARLTMAAPPSSTAPSPEPSAPTRVDEQRPEGTSGPGTFRQLAPGPVDESPAVAPPAPRRFPHHVVLDQEAHDDLRYLQELLSHRLPSGDEAKAIGFALRLAIRHIEKRKFAATDRPRRSASCSKAGSRYIPAQVRRAVWQRDGGQCTFMSASGKRCAARRLLEFDHMDEVARGGVATVSGVRLRCRAHNQYEAERTFGAGFMENRRRVAAEARAASAKREAAQSSAAAEAHAEVRAKAETAVRAQAAAAEVQAMAEARAKALEVIPWLRRLGIRADEARQAATHCETTPDAPLEERVRVALRSLGRPPRPPEPQRASLAPGRRV